MLGKLVVKSGLVTRDELDVCQQLIDDSSPEEPRVLTDLLLENDYLTRRQLDRLRDEFDDRKTTQRIPGYKITKKIGAGAMASVFLARQISLDRDVAIKVLPRKFSDNTNFIDRFYKEGRAAAQLNHPNIVGAFDVGHAGDHHYFVMEYVDGLTIYDKIRRKKRIPEARAVEIIIGVALALEHSHARGFIHRDIKPKNIMLTRDGVVKLADLGLARAMSDKEAAEAEAGRAYGTPFYISPEQIRGEVTIGAPADIYGLGATFFHMVTGRVPFEGKSPSSVMHKHLKAPLTPPDHINPSLSSGCALVIEMMMAKDPADRYQSATDLLEDLALVSAGDPPHFAQKDLNLSDIAESITGPANLPPVVQKTDSVGHSPAAAGPSSLILIILLVLSVLGNLILLAITLGS